jgi:hypothetical protein
MGSGPVRVFSNDLPGNQIYIKMTPRIPQDGNVVIKAVAPGDDSVGADVTAEPAEVSIDVQPGAPDDVEPSESE